MPTAGLTRAVLRFGRPLAYVVVRCAGVVDLNDGHTTSTLHSFVSARSSRLRSSSCFLMLHVRALTGDPVAELHVEELKALQEGSLVLALKRFLAAKLGFSRFRMKLLEEDRTEIDDDAPLTGAANILLVRMDFQASDPATNTAFVSACARGRVIEVERLLCAPQNPDARDAQKNCPAIHAAVRNGHLAIVRLLLEARADKDAALQNGTTALHHAAQLSGMFAIAAGGWC